MRKFFLLWFVGALLVVITLSRSNLIRFYRLAHEGVSTRGMVTALEPLNHQAVHYSYEVEGRSDKGIGWAGYGNPQFEVLSINPELSVYYLPKQPSISCIGKPDRLLRNEEIPIILAGLIVPTFVLFVGGLAYPRFRLWLLR